MKKRDEFDSKLLDVARVTRVVAGGRRFGFRILVAVGNKKGKLGIGVAKGADVASAINKATNQAKKNLINVPRAIPSMVNVKYRAAKIMIKPGQEFKIGGVLRQLSRLAGIKSITGKIMGSNNKINNAHAFIKAIKKLNAIPRPKSK